MVAQEPGLFRDALCDMLATSEALEVAAIDVHPQDIASRVSRLEPSIVLLTVSHWSVSTVAAMRGIKQQSPHAKALILSSEANPRRIRAALHAGADGYILTDASREELFGAIEAVLRGERFISPRISSHIAAAYLWEQASAARTDDPLEMLTGRQREVLLLIAEGLRSRDIAQRLSITRKTVEKHRANLLHKLGLHNSAALTRFALERGLVDGVAADDGEPPSEQESGESGESGRS